MNETASTTARNVGRCFFILGRAATTAMIQAKSGSNPPRSRIATPRMIDEVRPKANLALFDLIIDGNCVTTKRLNDETSMTAKLEAGITTFVKSFK